MPRLKAGGGRKLFVARQAFAATVNGETIVIQGEQHVDANDPVLKGREALFEDYDAYLSRKIRKYPGQRVEQATAAPGEKRGA